MLSFILTYFCKIYLEKNNFLYDTVIEFTVEFSHVNLYNTITKTTFLNQVPAIRDSAVQELDGEKA